MTSPSETIANVLEQSLHAVAESGEDLTPHFFARLFARHPDQEAMFFHPSVSCGAMVNEIMGSLLAQANRESWVGGSVQSLVIAHRCYGNFPLPLYADVLDLFVETLADLAGPRWSAEYDAAWRSAVADLQALIAHAH